MYLQVEFLQAVELWQNKPKEKEMVRIVDTIKPELKWSNPGQTMGSNPCMLQNTRMNWD